MMSQRDLKSFDRSGYDKGRPRAVQALWFAVQSTVFSSWLCPASVRVAILRLFGASVGDGVVIRHRVRVLWPWKLVVGDHSWIGEGAWLLNLEPITLGGNVCVSQEALLCTGSHAASDPRFGYRNAPITVGDGAWVCARAIVLAGSHVAENEVVKAGQVRAPGAPRGEPGPGVVGGTGS